LLKRSNNLESYIDKECCVEYIQRIFTPYEYPYDYYDTVLGTYVDYIPTSYNINDFSKKLSKKGLLILPGSNHSNANFSRSNNKHIK